jgi:iron complex outermembrane recepter protein
MRNKNWLQGTSILVLALCVALPAAAQEKAPEKENPDVVIVTANKRKEKAFDVAQTVNVVTSETLQKLNVTNFEDVQKLTPGLKMDHGGQGRNNVVTLRGVQFNPDSSGTPTVDIYQNEVLVPAATALQAMYDVGNVQVLRGPQGTLRSGTGPSGALLITTKQPSLSRTDGYVAASASDNDTANLQFGANVPIVEGKLAVRLAGLYDHNDGNGANSRNFDNPDHSQTTSGRVSVLWKPVDNLTINAMFNRLHSRKILTPTISGVGPQGTILPSDRIGLSKIPTAQTMDSDVFTLEAAYDMGENRLTYLGGYQKSLSTLYRDGDTINASGLGKINLLSLRTPGEITSHEVRFERTGDHFWIYRFGYFKSRTPNGSKTESTGLTANFYGLDGSCSLAQGCIRTTLSGSGLNRQEGYFTTHTFKFTPNDVLELGLRHNKTEQTGFSAFTVFSNTTKLPTNNSYESTTGSANYKHYWSKDMMTYINYGTSFRPGATDSFGTFQYSFLQPAADFFNIKPEKSTSIELGFKRDFFNKRFQIQSAIYNQKYNNFIYRLNGLFCTGAPNATTGPNANTVYATTTGAAGGPLCQNNSVSLNGNADVAILGYELEVRARLFERWIVTTGVSYNDSHFDDALVYCNDFNGDGIPDQTGAAAIQKGKYISTCKTSAPLGALPKWQLTINSDYSFPLAGDWEGFTRGLATIRPKFNDVLTGGFSEKSDIIDLFLGARSGKGLEVSVFVKNLLDDQAVDGFGTTANTYIATAIPHERRYGVQMRQSF